ncbi:hypothetical protein Q9L58_010459 [Maublancomyces gigas]|uniref:RNase H type-1 domain-containing protein n=1 Tax=Discina gigas TaxID=1032678 RepID=A0ABR3G430_9PEZI
MNCGMLNKISKRKGTSPGAIHYLATAITIPGMTWGSEIWWTGATHIISQLTPAYHNIARCITGLPKWTAIPALLSEPSHASLESLLDRNSRKYGIKILLAEDDHPCKETLLWYMTAQSNGASKTGLQRIADLLKDIFANSWMEDTTHHHCEFLAQPHISAQGKAQEGSDHRIWVNTIPTGTIVLYTDGSKAEDGTTSSAWHCIQIEDGHTLLFQGQCQIGHEADIEDGEIHAIQEGLHELRRRQTDPTQTYLCVDNQNALRSLSGGPTSG